MAPWLSGYYWHDGNYYLTPEQITLDCLDWVGSSRWTDNILCNPLTGQPQKAKDSLCAFLNGVIAICGHFHPLYSPYQRKHELHSFKHLDALSDLINSDLIPPLEQLIRPFCHPSVIPSVGRWTNTWKGTWEEKRWYHLSPQGIIMACLDSVYLRLYGDVVVTGGHGSMVSVVDKLRWMHGLWKDQSSGVPQKAYDSVSTFLACVCVCNIHQMT